MKTGTVTFEILFELDEDSEGAATEEEIIESLGDELEALTFEAGEDAAVYNVTGVQVVT